MTLDVCISRGAITISAREQFQDAMDLNKTFGDKHVNTTNCCHNLASTYLHIGSYPLSMRQELLGHNEQTLSSLETLERIHLKMGNFFPL